MPFLAPEPLSESPYSAEAIDQYLDLASRKTMSVIDLLAGIEHFQNNIYVDSFVSIKSMYKKQYPY